MRRLFLALVTTCFALSWTAAGASAASACPPLDYLAAMGQTEAALSSTPPDVAGATALLQRMRGAYPQARPTLNVVLAELQASPPRPDAARAGVATIARTLALPRGSTCNADQRPARSALDGVYRSPVFANLDQKPPGPNPIGQFLAWLASLLRDLTGALGPAASIALGAVLLAGALALAAWLLRGMLGSRPARAAVAEAADSTDPEREWALADQAAQRGDHREAVRRAFRSALLTVADRGRLAVDPSWTTRELLAATRADAGLLTALAPAAALFDRAWYSGAAVTEADWRHARDRCSAVRELARGRQVSAS